uniref:Anaphase-promoting complex subunit 10 n=1 Tax=Panagrellus redivivus TaxID=6233 RepID=A0A7E4ZQ21_PANRE
MDRLQLEAKHRKERLNIHSKTWGSKLPEDEDLIDLTYRGAWTLSSCKIGNGIQQLLDPNIEPYWQSDGPQPHVITIEFPEKTAISYVLMYLDYKIDESYTPSKIHIYTGSSAQDVERTSTATFAEPKGWELIEVKQRSGTSTTRCFVLQIHIIANHQNGRDTHIRGVKIIGPRDGNEGMIGELIEGPSKKVGKSTNNYEIEYTPIRASKRRFVSDFEGLTIR